MKKRPPFRRWRLLHRIKLAERRDEITLMQKLGYELMKHEFEIARQEVRMWRQKHPDGDALGTTPRANAYRLAK